MKQFSAYCSQTLQLAGGLLLLALVTVTARADDVARVSVSGEAELRLTPDMARVEMAVSHTGASVKEVQQTVAQVVGAFLELADDLDIDEKWIRTTGAVVRPSYRWDREQEEQVFTGYTVERNIELELRQLDKLGPLLERAGQLGINRISPPMLDSSKRPETHRRALALAFADARANAEVLADAAGADLGDAISISASADRPPVMPMMRASAAIEMSDDAGASYTPGELTVTARISAVFVLDY